MKPNETEKRQMCALCDKPYRGANTYQINTGYSVYKDFPAHVECCKTEAARIKRNAKEFLRD